MAEEISAGEIQLVRGAPTDEELAAIVGVLLTRPRGVDAAAQPVSRWGRSARSRATERSPASWRASALPR